tara:strand:+ start:1177 stop:1815 length:639 start_codon:yes stop_codon:yes gene_type:complete
MSLKDLEQICQCHEITIAKMRVEKKHFLETIKSLEHQNAQLVSDLEQQEKNFDNDQPFKTTTVRRQEEENLKTHMDQDLLQILNETMFEQFKGFQCRLNRLIEMSRENRKHVRRIRNAVKRLFDRIKFESSRVESLRSQEMRLSTKIRDLMIEREYLKDVLRKSRVQHMRNLQTQRELKSSQSVLRAQVTCLENKKIELTERLLDDDAASET